MDYLITDNLRKLEIIKTLELLLEEYDLIIEDPSIDKLVYDAVYDFVSLLDLSVDPVELKYIIRLLYTNKGTTEVLELMKSHLGIDVDYTYNVVNLSLTIHSITTSNPNNLNSKLNMFLHVLLYYHELVIIFEKVIFLIKQKLDTYYNHLNVETYNEYEVTWDNPGGFNYVLNYNLDS